MDCIFCKIINKEISARIVFENEHTLALLDIMPTNPGHALVVSKEHFSDLLSVSDNALQEIIKTVKLVARAITEGLKSDGFNIIQNNGRVAGQMVDHLHFHIIPRKSGDGFEHWNGTKYSSDEEADNIAEKIKSMIIFKCEK